uniref:Uncharacterized protein n=1 Tax=Arundo donax TaxID=35708 RepID=A0A0A9HYJ0_ARUDO
MPKHTSNPAKCSFIHQHGRYDQFGCSHGR